LEGSDFLANKALTVHYEELVSMPEKVTKRICSYLNVEFHTTMIEYGIQKAPSGSMGDPVKIHKHSNPVPDYVDTWIDAFTSRQTRHFAESYLEALGPEVLRRLGYSFYDLKIMLVSQKFSDRNCSVIIPWELLLGFRQQQTTWDDIKLRILLSAQSKGSLRTVQKYGRRFIRLLFTPFF